MERGFFSVGPFRLQSRELLMDDEPHLSKTPSGIKPQIYLLLSSIVSDATTFIHWTTVTPTLVSVLIV